MPIQVGTPLSIKVNIFFLLLVPTFTERRLKEYKCAVYGEGCFDKQCCDHVKAEMTV